MSRFCFAGETKIRVDPSKTELRLYKANASETDDPFLDLHLSFSDGFVSSRLYDKRDEIYFDIVSFSSLDGDDPRSSSNGFYISQLIRFARVSSRVTDFNARHKILTTSYDLS